LAPSAATGRGQVVVLIGEGAQRPIAGRPRQVAGFRATGTDTRQSQSATTRSMQTRMNSRYNAADIEVLSGLDPVKRRPGMYTDTTRPNHLAQEVVDNAVDEALAGHAETIEVTLHADGSCEVSDDGRGMPVDIHPERRFPASN
jgi:hypothetical protein